MPQNVKRLFTLESHLHVMLEERLRGSPNSLALLKSKYPLVKVVDSLLFQKLLEKQVNGDFSSLAHRTCHFREKNAKIWFSHQRFKL